jgi:hypothetical protein
MKLTFIESVSTITNTFGLYYFIAKKFHKFETNELVNQSILYLYKELLKDELTNPIDLNTITKEAKNGLIRLDQDSIKHDQSLDILSFENDYLIALMMQYICLVFRDKNNIINNISILESVKSIKPLIKAIILKNSYLKDHYRNNTTLTNVQNALNIPGHSKPSTIQLSKEKNNNSSKKFINKIPFFFNISLLFMTSISALISCVLIVLWPLGILSGWGSTIPDFLTYLFLVISSILAVYVVFLLRSKPFINRNRKIIIKFVHSFQFLFVAVPLFAVSGGLIIFILFNSIINPLQRNFILKFDHYFCFTLF